MDDLKDLLIELASDSREAVRRAARGALVVDLDRLPPLSELMASDQRHGEAYKRAVMAGFNESRESESEVFEIGGGEYVLQRVPGESAEEYEERKTLFDDLKKSGGRLVIAVEDLPESVIDRLRAQADGDDE